MRLLGLSLSPCGEDGCEEEFLMRLWSPVGHGPWDSPYSDLQGRIAEEACVNQGGHLGFQLSVLSPPPFLPWREPVRRPAESDALCIVGRKTDAGIWPYGPASLVFNRLCVRTCMRGHNHHHAGCKDKVQPPFPSLPFPFLPFLVFIFKVTGGSNSG